MVFDDSRQVLTLHNCTHSHVDEVPSLLPRAVG